jgi:hypothetical protein
VLSAIAASRATRLKGSSGKALRVPGAGSGGRGLSTGTGRVKALVLAGAPAGVLPRTFMTAASAEVVTLHTGIQRSRVQAPTL